MAEDCSELDYIVWQYLQKETPTLATEFEKLKNIKGKGACNVTLAIIYDIYMKDKSMANKREIEQEDEKPPVNKKSRLDQDEKNSEELNTSKLNKEEIDTSEIEDQNEKEDDTNVTDRKTCTIQEEENGDKDAKSTDEEKSPINDDDSAKEKSESNKTKKKKALLPKPSNKQRNKKKKPLLAAPISLFHQNDPDFYSRHNTKKPLLSGLVPTIEPSGRKTLLAEPLYSGGRNERMPLLSGIPMHDYSEEERIRRTILAERSHLFPQDERAKKPLLMEPVPPSLLGGSSSRIDRLALLAELPPLSRLHLDSNERMSLLNHPSLSDQLDVLYRRERKSLLNEPPKSMIDYMKRKEKESLLMDPSSSDHYYDIQNRNVGVLTELPLSLNMEGDMKRKKRALLSDWSPPLPLQEYALDRMNASDHLYNRKQKSSLSKPLTYPDTQEYDDSSCLYSRRIRTKEPMLETSNWKGKDALLVELKNYLKKHLSQEMEKSKDRNSLLAKPSDIQNYEANKLGRIPDFSRMSPDLYEYFMREKNTLLARRDYYQELPDSFAEKARVDKSRADLSARKEKSNRNKESLMPASSNMQNYEESLKSIGSDHNSKLSHSYRRSNESEFHSLNRDTQHKSYDRYSGKMGFL